MQCPRCQGTRVIKNGRIHNGKPKWLCKDCRRQCVEHPQHRVIEASKGLIDKLLLERVSLAGMARVAEVLERWLQYYVNAHYAALPRAVTVTAKKRGGSSSSATSGGRLSAINGSSNGCGWHLTVPAGRWSGWQSAHAMRPLPVHSGRPCRQSTVKVRCAIPTAGRPTRLYSRLHGIRRFARRAAKPVTSNG
jgi:hypothetical protein